MKKLLYLITLLIFSLAFSQEKTIPSGEYSSDKLQQEKVNILLQDNKRYLISVLSGIYEQKNDSIYFHTDGENEPTFKLEFGYDNPNSKKIKLNFDGLFINYGDDKYIGVQETVTSEVVYKTVEDFTNFKAQDYNENSKYEIEINHCYALYFVKESIYSESIIEKFILPKDISSIKVNYNKTSYNQVNLTGYYNQQTKVLSVGSNGKNILNFEIKKDEKQASLYTKPTEKNTIKNWTYSGKIATDDYYNQAVDSASVEPSAPAYSFKLKIEKSLKDAFNATKNSKDKSRFLVIINDANNKNIEQEFKDFINAYQENIGYSMYDGYNAEYDHFDFYLANSNDKAELKKYGITDNPSITYFNTNGTKLYNSKEKISSENFSYYNTNSINSELKILNSNAKFDEAFSNKKATYQETLDVFYEITKQEVPYSYDTTEVYPVVDEVRFVPPVVSKEQIKEIPIETTPVVEAVNNIGVVEDYAVDSTAVAVTDSNYDYNLLNIKENKYKFKTSQAQVNDKWLKVLESHQQDKIVNKKLALTIVKELNNKGFSRILFQNNETVNSKIYHLELDYILKHYDAILNFNATNEEANYDSDYYSVYDFKYTVTNFLNQSILKENCKTKDDLTKGMARLKNFVNQTNNDPSVTSSYMEALINNDYQLEFLAAYQGYFNSVIKDNSSIIEQLDAAFASKQAENYSANWVEFKYDFANKANSAAWFVVEKVKDANLIKKAIGWSETSLVIQKDDRYYLDTLAQLYYKDGQKEKAILTEQRAIDVLSDDEFSQREEYKVVLEKMKNGTY